MKKIISLLFAIIVACGASFAKQGTEIKVISYNIRTLARDGSNSWQFRKHATANMLHRHAPDAFGLQEAMVAHLAFSGTKKTFSPRYSSRSSSKPSPSATSSLYLFSNALEI